MKILAVAAPSVRIHQIVGYVTAYGHAMEVSSDAMAALQVARVLQPNVIVVDDDELRMPAIDWCQRVRASLLHQAPIIFLSQRSSLEVRLHAFRRDATDNSSQRLSVEDLDATLTALMRLAHDQPLTATLAVADLIYNPETCQTWRAGQEIVLTPASRRLLSLLMREAPRLVSTHRLSTDLWGDSPPPGATIRSHIYTLRAAIDRGHTQKLLRTVLREGYRLDPGPQT